MCQFELGNPSHGSSYKLIQRVRQSHRGSVLLTIAVSHDCQIDPPCSRAVCFSIEGAGISNRLLSSGAACELPRSIWLAVAGESQKPKKIEL